MNCPLCGSPLPARLTITPDAAIVRDEWLTDGHRITTQKIRVIYFKKEGEYENKHTDRAAKQATRPEEAARLAEPATA